jgi:uncharacterized membrane protein
MRIIDNKKAMELSLQTIVIFIIVLIVLIFIFMFYTSNYTSGSEDLYELGSSAIDNARFNTT